MRSAPSLAFALTFLAYVALHAERKAYTNVKSAAVADWHMTPDALSVLDTTFMLTYAAGLYASGALGDATSPKTVLLGGLLASTFIVMAIGLAGSLGAHLVVVALMALNGLAQSTVWPNAVAIMAAHFPEASRGSIMGVWSVNGNVGNLLGGMFTGAAQSSGLSIQATLAVPSVFTMGVAFVVWRYLRSTPSASPSNPDERDPIIIKPVMATKGIGVWRALQIPGVVEYSLAYACIKNVNYSAMFWISFWLSSELHFADADASLLSSWYDIGAITGGVLIGFVSDRARLRCLPCVVSMAFASVALAMLTATTPSWGMLAVLLAVNGALINGPSALISSAISADLGSHPTVQQSENAMATVAGVVDGTGALGAAVGQYAIAAFSDSFGWNASFYMLAALCLASCILLRRSLQRDIATVTKRVFGTIEVSRQSSELHKLGDHVH
ncbi:unnamed protein product (mitochondrion) [Plasmodiophora brassicae]|uniref:Major facilitator superfamily (MFS) profile domain-containing protein n=1 Tax=Plasmodiophora brassicae TaxID=37360 RepID=A0A0G4J8Q0_PLABS|nr:hypothetical protein PBRA_003331 [Plasmodiophora brassicae]SPQ99684.1 unnamed protein product [Plasmodiophora brassicae]